MAMVTVSAALLISKSLYIQDWIVMSGVPFCNLVETLNNCSRRAMASDIRI